MKKLIVLIVSLLIFPFIFAQTSLTNEHDKTEQSTVSFIDPRLLTSLKAMLKASLWDKSHDLSLKIQQLESSTLSLQEKGRLFYEIGSFYFYEKPTTFFNATFCYELFETAAILGNTDAQFQLGVAYSTGFWQIPRNDAKAILYYYFASMGNHIGSLMALGHRHQYGLNVPKNCETAILYYEKAASLSMHQDQSVDYSPNNPIKLKSLLEGGNKPSMIDEDVAEYYEFQANKGDIDAMLSLGLLRYYGVRGFEKNLKDAFHYFQRAVEGGSAQAKASLGHMYLHGFGAEKNLSKAFLLFQQAANEGLPGGQNGLGYMYLYGLTVEKDTKRAKELFEAAMNQGYSEAMYNLGLLYMGVDDEHPSNFKEALNYFFLAARNSHTNAMHKIALMHMHGIGTIRSCTTALQYFKLVAERGNMATTFKRAYHEYVSHHNRWTALNLYVMLSEMGYEVAQYNTAFLIDEQIEKTNFFNTFLNLLIPTSKLVTLPFAKAKEGETAVKYYRLAANQGNVEANLKIGDYYYYGIGNLTSNRKRALVYYNQAARKHNPQAIYNVGYMYEYGISVKQDFTLAKRWYDSAVQNSEARLKVPGKLALHMLQVHQTSHLIYEKYQTEGLYVTLLYLLRYVVNLQNSMRWEMLQETRLKLMTISSRLYLSVGKKIKAVIDMMRISRVFKWNSEHDEISDYIFLFIAISYQIYLLYWIYRRYQRHRETEQVPREEPPREQQEEHPHQL